MLNLTTKQAAWPDYYIRRRSELAMHHNTEIGSYPDEAARCD